jgi:SAM-dependent methyltransferase
MGEAMLSGLLRELEREAEGMSTVTLPRAGKSYAPRYFETAQWSLRPIRLALLAARRPSVESVLDLPCGDGRILRALRAELPGARIVACDINRELVDFCAETFDAIPVYAREDPQDTPLEGPFDLIWCGSLLTHVDAPLWTAFLQLFESLLEPGGVLVFSTCGRFAAERVRSGRGTAALTNDEVEAMLRDYERSGFGYGRYSEEGRDLRRSLSLPDDYGYALAAPSWVCARVQEAAPKLDMLGFLAGGNGPRWGDNRPPNNLNGQDIVSCIRVRD